MTASTAPDLTAIADALLDRARKAGADAADAVVVSAESLSVSARSGALEEAEREETLDFGLRVMIQTASGAQEAIVSASDPKPDTLDALAQRAVAMAREAPATPEARLATVEELAKTIPDLDLIDPEAPPTPEALLETAMALEAKTKAVDGVTQVDGAGAAWSRARRVMRATNGASVDYESGSHSISATAVAGAEGSVGMERDYAYATRRRQADLPMLDEIAIEAGERAVKRLNPKRGKTGAFPVVFEPRVAAGLVGSLIGVLNGASVARGSSFLKDKMGEPVLPAGMDLIDDPLAPRGLGSRPVDGDGLAPRRKRLIADGVLSEWLLDLVSATKLGLASNGSAARGVASSPSPSASNAWLTAGALSQKALIEDIREGLFVVETMGQGLNPVTGDYSRAATGFWIENGEIAYPVSELTIAGSMPEMLRGLTAADDLELTRRIASPTLRIESMTIAAD